MAASDLKYEAAIGRFVLYYTETETALYWALLRYSNVEDAVGRAIFSGTRASVMMAYIRTIKVNTDNITEARWSDLDSCITQLATINSARDELIHFGTRGASLVTDEADYVVSNQARVNRVERAYRKTFNATLLDNMTHDLIKIRNHLYMHLGEIRGTVLSPSRRSA